MLCRVLCVCVPHRQALLGRYFADIFSWLLWILWLHQLARLIESMWRKRKQHSELAAHLTLLTFSIVPALYSPSVYYFFSNVSRNKLFIYFVHCFLLLLNFLLSFLSAHQFLSIILQNYVNLNSLLTYIQHKGNSNYQIRN